MKTTLTTEGGQPQMPPLEIKPQNKFMEEEVRSIELVVGAEPHIVVQNENTKTAIKQPIAQDVIQ